MRERVNESAVRANGQVSHCEWLITYVLIFGCSEPTFLVVAENHLSNELEVHLENWGIEK